MTRTATKITPRHNRLLREARETAASSKTTMKNLAKIYNRYNTGNDKITNCMCSKVGRKVYHEIIYDWYDQTTH